MSKSQYSVYLVDDEKWALYDLMHFCPFEKYGFKVIGDNTDPLLAISEIKEKKPDVVFVDVKMPNIQGFELIDIVKEDLPGCTFIVVSGYNDFEYARSALRRGAFDYCLKPVTEEDAVSLFSKLRSMLDQKRNPIDDDESLQQEDIYNEITNHQFALLLQYVNENIYEPLTLGALAQKYYLNVSYCGDLFKKITGDTFINYVRKRRLHQASIYLKHSSLSISQIAVKVGYSDLPYFSRLFTKSYGISPSNYRLKNKGKMNDDEKA